MLQPNPQEPAHERQPLYYFNGGFFTQKQVRRILDLAGYDLKLGKPGADDLIAVWGKSPTSGRGAMVSDHTGAGLVHVEDAPLRSVRPGRAGTPPLGLTVDHRRPHFDASGPSDLEVMLATAPLDDSAYMTRARDAMQRIKDLQLAKYNDFPLDAELPAPGYVLVIDQVRDDAAIKDGPRAAATFREMLVFAQEDHPGARIVIKSHPETMAGHRQGFFGPDDTSDHITLLDHPVSPYALMEGAMAVYTVSSGMGFEAILADHKPIVFGQPFYAGWGLSVDHQPIDRRRRRLTRAQLFTGAMMLYPKWYDPYSDQLCEIEQLLDTLEAQARAWRQDHSGHIALGMRLWKRGHLQKMFGQHKKLRFQKPDALRPNQLQDQNLLIWAGQEPDGLEAKLLQNGANLTRVEDGFLRSRGLGAALTPPLSLVTDKCGIYYDPTRLSALEALISQSPDLPEYARRRAAKLRDMIIKAGLTKYNLSGQVVDIDAQGREIILVAGQVEDDASVLKGTRQITTNQALLETARRDFPDAYLIYKPHPDAEAGLRQGALSDSSPADMIAHDIDPAQLLAQVHRVCTMTSLLGFEALLRGIPVTTYGTPFYAGWGLSDDRGDTPARRRAQVDLDGLTHAALIAYPRYFDPVTALPCPPEIAVLRLINATATGAGWANRLLSKAQGALASYAYLWR